MKERICKAVLLLLGCAGTLVAGAAVSFTELTDQGVLDAAAAAVSTQYRASTSLTIKLSGTATEGVFTLMPSFYIPSGVTLTVDGSEVSGLTTVRLKGGLRGTGTVAFGAGITKLVIGAAPTLTNILGDKNVMPALESDVSFVETSGSVEIVEGVSLVRWPASSPYTIAGGTVLATMGKNLFEETTLELTTWDLILTRDDAFPKGATIVVPTGRKLYYRPTSLYAVTDSKAYHVQAWSGDSGQTHEVNVTLNGGTLELQSKTDGNTIKGDLTGTGSVFFQNAGSVAFDGKIDLEGQVDLTNLGSQKTCAFRMSAESSMSRTELLGCNVQKLELSAAEGEVVSVKKVTASGTLNLYIGTGGSVGLESLEATGLNVSGKGGRVAVAGSGLDVTLYPNVTLALASFGDVSKPLTLAAEDGASDVVWSLEGTASDALAVSLTNDAAIATIVEGSKMRLAGKLDIVTALPVSEIDIAQDAEVRVSTSARIVNAGGSVELVPSWQTKVGLWLDANESTTFTYAKDHLKTIDWTGLGLTEQTAPEGYLYEWADCRTWQREVSLRSVVFDNFKNKPAYAQTVFPVVPTVGGEVDWNNGTAGKPRLTLGGRSRTQSSPNNVSLKTKCIVAVFSAQYGGGTALFMEKDGKLKRTTETSSNTSNKAWPICLDSSVSARTNGVAVATGSGEPGFTGDWQLVTLSCATDLEILGIGHAYQLNTGSGNGGQSYREILIFNEEPTEAERAAAERYLAEKWNLPYAGGAGSEETLSVVGKGSVKMSGNAMLDTDDYFSGTLDLNGKRLSIGSVKLPFKAAQIPAKDRLLWVDPRLTGAVQYCDDPNKPDEVTMVYTRDNNGLLTADGSYYLVSPFKPGIENTNANRRVRYTSGWFDFRNAYTDDTRGNLMFMRKLPYAAMEQFDDSAEELDDVSAGFFSLDSSRNGGGSLMLSAANGTTKLLRARNTSATAPIWSLESGSTVTIATWLNGDSVAMSDPFSGGRDVMSFNVNNEDSLLVKCFGYAKTGSQSYSNNEILGEWLLYSANVPVTDRERIEAYLSFKWKNVLMDGFSETRDLTVSGAGVIAVAQADALPVLGAAFTGSVELTEDRYAFTLPQAGAQAVDAVVLPDRTLALQANVTIDVNATGAKAGTYLLMSAQTLGSGTTFTLGTVTDPKGRTVRLFVQDNALYCTVQPNGLILLVK